MRLFSQAILLAFFVVLFCTAPIDRILAVESTGEKSQAAIAARFPPNYRAMMARYILTHSRRPIRDVFISKLYERYGGILHGGGTVPMACVLVNTDTMFGPGTFVWPLTIIDGKVEKFEPAIAETFNNACNKNAPFTEVKKALKR